MAAVIPSGWTEPGVVIAACGLVGGFTLWAWGHMRKVLPWEVNAKRLAKLEETSATREEVAKLGTELRKMHDEHVASDAANFGEVLEKVEHIQDTMARRDDVAALQNNLMHFLIEGRRP